MARPSSRPVLCDDAGVRALPHLLALALLFGCGGATSSGGGAAEANSPATLDPAEFLEALGASASAVFRPPAQSSDEIDTARREARGAERRALMRDLAVALYHEAAAEESARRARRIRQRADRMVQAARRGNRDQALAAELDMIDLWQAWRGERLPRAERLSERFTRRHEAAGVLTGIAWMIRGEVAQAQDQYDAAQNHYRFALGQIGTPLYAFALYRTAHAHRALGEADEAVQALSEVEQMGCEEGADDSIVHLAAAAASEQGSGLRLDTDGVMRPARCPSPEDRAAEEPEEEGWRPAE